MAKRMTLPLVAVAVQLGILAVIPARQIYTRSTGTLVTIRTAPVDPYDVLSGYYVTLAYEISTPPGLNGSPGNNERVYVVLVPGEDNVWVAQSTYRTRPASIPPGAVVVRGWQKGMWVRYGIEAFYVPEENREEIERALRQNQGTAKAQIKVDRFGHAALERLIIADKTYEH